MHKKAQEMLGFFVFFAVLVAVGVFITYRSLQGGPSDFIGSKQLQLLTAAKEADKAQIYLEQSVKIVTPNSIRELANKESGCGYYLGFPIWSNRTLKCDIEDTELKTKYIGIFNDNVDELLAKYRSVRFSTANYRLAFNDGKKLKIIGKSNEPLSIPFAGAATFTAEQIDTFYGKRNSNLAGQGNCLVDAELRTGIPAAVTMAVTGIESSFGTGGILVGKSKVTCTNTDSNPNNPFSIASAKVRGEYKAGTAGVCTIGKATECIRKGTEQEFLASNCVEDPTCTSGYYSCEVHNRVYKAYATPCDSVNEFVDLIRSKRYWEGEGIKSGNPDCEPVKDFVNNPERMLQEIQECGYIQSTGWTTAAVSLLNNNIRKELGVERGAGSGGIYSVNPNFKTEINYSFKEYDAIKNNLTKISADISNICLTRENQDECVADILSKEKNFKWSLECGSEEEKAFSNIIETFILCSQSIDEGVCSFNIPDTNKISFSLKWDQLRNQIEATSKRLNLTIEQDRPLIADTFSPEKRPILITCDEITFNIEDQRAVLEARNCAGKGDVRYIYDKQIPLIKISSRAGAGNFVMFPEPSAYSDVKSSLNQIKLVKQEIRLCVESKYNSAPIQTGNYNVARAPESVSAVPICEGGDISKISQTKLKNCAQYHDLFSGILNKISLPFDPLLIDAQAYQETLCDPYANAGGILQSDAFCLNPTPSSTRYDPSKSDQWACPTVDIQAEKSLLELSKYYESFKDMSPMDSITLTLFAYNRFIEPAKKARTYYESGMPLYDAMKKACLEEYGTEATSKNAPGGRTWSEYFKALKAAGNQNVAPYEISDDYYCGTISGPSYPTRIIKNFEDTCKQIGGTIVIKAPTSGTNSIKADSEIKTNYDPYIYKIAFFVGDTVSPNPVPEISAIDTKPAEKNITVSFKSNEEPDIDHYNVYYSTESFDKITQTIQLLGSVKHDDSESYSKTFKVPEDRQYYFAVVAVDKSGNANNNVVAVQGRSEDDIDPGTIEGITVERTGSLGPKVNILITKPLKNIDGTDIDDLSQYTIFIKKVDSDSCTGITPKQVIDNNKFDIFSFEVTEQGQHRIANKDFSLIDNQAIPGTKYCVVAIAQDETAETTMTPNRYSDKSMAFISFG